MIITKPTPESNPRGAIIGFNNLLTDSTTDDAKKALVPNTYERWRPSSGAVTVKFQMGVAAEIDFIGIAAHNLSGESFVLSTAETIGGATTDVEGFSLTDNTAVMATFEPRTVQEIVFTSTLSSDNEIGVVSAGKALKMQRNIYGGHSPINLSPKTTFQSEETETGQFLSQNIIREGLSTSFSWKFLDPDWYRENFQPFALSARRFPFFIKWRPDLYNDEVAYTKTEGNIKPKNMGGGHNKMSVSINIKGHADS